MLVEDLSKKPRVDPDILSPEILRADPPGWPVDPDNPRRIGSARFGFKESPSNDSISGFMESSSFGAPLI